MTRLTMMHRKLRGQLLLSASLLATGFAVYGRPAAAADPICVEGEANSYRCSGEIANRADLSSFTDITVIADETAKFQEQNDVGLYVSGGKITIDVKEGATFASGLQARQPAHSVSGTTGVDVLFNGSITQRDDTHYSVNGIQVGSKYGDVNVMTGLGDISLRTDLYNKGIYVYSDGPGSGNVSITTGTGDITSGEYGIYAYGRNAVEITTGEGIITAEYGIRARGANSTITVNGDVFLREGDGRKYYGSGVGASSVGEMRNVPLEEQIADNTGLNKVTINSGVTIDATNGKYGVVTHYGNSEIVVAGTVIGGERAAIRTNTPYFPDGPSCIERRSESLDGPGGCIVLQSDYPDGFGPIELYPDFPDGRSRVELQSGFDITGNVIAGGQRTDDVLVLGGAGDLSFDISKISIGQREFEYDRPFLVLAEIQEQPELMVDTPDGKQYFNFDLFEKVGAGTATIFGTNDEIDNFAIREGTLRLDTAQAAAMEVDLIGGQLTGDGMIGNLIARTGTTVAPGNGSAFGTIGIANNLSFETGSTFAVDLATDGATDLLDVGGSAEIQSGVGMTVVVEQGESNLESLEWTVISTEGGVTGEFDTVTDTLIDVDFVDVYDGETVRLVATVAQAPVGNGGTSDKTNGPAGTVGAGLSGATFARTLSEVPSQNGDGSEVVSRGGFVASGPGLQRAKTQTGVPGTLGAMDMSAFFGTFNEQTDVETNGTAAGYDSNSTGLMGGVSFADTFNDDLAYQVNVGLGYSTTLTGTSGGSAEADDYHFGVGGVIESGALTVSGAFGYTLSDLDLKRQVGTSVATAQTDARTLSGVVEASYDLATTAGLSSSATLAPLVRIRGYSTTADAYTETGAGLANLNVDEISSDVVYGGIGLHYSDTHALGNTLLRPSVRVIYDSKLSGDDVSSIATIAGVNGAFDTAVNTGPDHLFSIDTGVAFDIEENVEGFVNYGATFGEDLDSRRVSVGMTISF